LALSAPAVHLEEAFPSLLFRPRANSSVGGPTGQKLYIVLYVSSASSQKHTHTANLRNSINLAAGEVPAVKAYDAYIKSALIPLVQNCDDLGGLENMGDLLKEAWEGIRTIIVLASRAKVPTEENIGVALAPHLSQTQEAVTKIRGLKLGREWDCQQRAIVEMMACLSWVLIRAPKGLPAGMVKETMGSAEFWLNRVRKEYKGKDDKQMEFCNSIKPVIFDLAEYVNEYHKTGLAFNPRGVSLAEAAIRLSDEPSVQDGPDPLKSSLHKRHPTGTNVVPGGNIAGMIGELSKRKSAEGDSAATGLKKVSLVVELVLNLPLTVAVERDN
jgi:adenylyl cyclase-associated protein